ncbi:Retrovirus-related Pol polyprotein from transposon TNT 1-94 [Sesamum angolense]|uniref:Retrovirus-related Pol polyprotein from transposon TNT 1-94 n=1 Tax=Sesamum angolense TaxID=2727404 RepID=A0AAE1X3D4_9LAMI|nr:Retrovirus-related Pol polyprotein from transposon TNT 1-94 [Sesamum angolense]
MGLSGRFYEVGSLVECVQGNRNLAIWLHEEFLKLEKELESSSIEIAIPEYSDVVGGADDDDEKQFEKVAAEAGSYSDEDLDSSDTPLISVKDNRMLMNKRKKTKTADMMESDNVYTNGAGDVKVDTVQRVRRRVQRRPKFTYGPTHFNLLDGKTHQPRPTLNLPASHTRPGLISLTLITLTSLSPFSFTPHPFPMPRFVSLSLSRCLVLHRLLLVFSPSAINGVLLFNSKPLWLPLWLVGFLATEVEGCWPLWLKGITIGSGKSEPYVSLYSRFIIMAGYNLQPFDGKTDFSIWQQKMKGILIQQKVFKAIDGKYADTVSDDKKLENDEYAYSSIILNLSDSVIRKVGKQESAKELWKKLEELYTETSLPSKLFLLEKIFRYKLDLSKNIDENIDDFTKLIQDIKLTGDKNIDDYSPIVLLNAIPETYGDVKAAIKYGRDNVNLETVVSGLKSKEMDLKTNKPSQNQNEVNFVRGRTKNRNSDYKYRRHSKSRSRSRGRSTSRNKYRNDKNNNDRNNEEKPKEKRCYNCGGRGHFIKDCRKPKKNDSKDTANVADSDEVYMICDVNSVSSSLKINEWLIDSGCTYHMTPFREILTNYKSEKLGSVSMANEKICDVYGYGDVCLIFENGFKLTLKNVRHVPDLAHNLISCSALEEEGLEGKWGKGVMKIMKGSLTVFKAERKRNLYICSVKYECHTASVSKITSSDLWHKRLGHISMKGLDFLHKNGILKEKPVEFDFCDECVLGKQHKVHFPSSPSQNPPLLSPSVPLSGKIPECVWTDSDVNLSSLRIFGCSAFALSHGDKLDPRSQKCVFIGYPDGVKGYRLWLRSQPGFKVLISRDVIFNESEFPCLSKTPKKVEDYNIESTFNKVEEPIKDNQQGEENRVETETENENLETGDNLNHYLLARDRERREPRIPAKLRDFQLALNTKNLEEPTSYNEALKTPESENWF